MHIELSIVIPTYNRHELLARTLPTVLRQDFPCDRYEVIVAVDGSDDGTLKFLRDLKCAVPLRVVDLPHRGRSAALNAAIGDARGRVVLVLDDDLLCCQELAREHCRAHVGTDDVAAFGTVLSAEQNDTTLAAHLRCRGLRNYFSAVSCVSQPARVAFGNGNTSVLRSRLLAAGGFDESLVDSCEETDCGFRLWKSGVRFQHLPQAMTHEIYVKTAAQVVRGAAAQGRNEFRLCLKHPDYRAHSRLRQLRNGAWWRRVLRRLSVQSPVDPDPVLALMTWAAERLRQSPTLEAAGVRLLGARMGLAFYRGALCEAGSWGQLASHVPADSGVCSLVPQPTAEQPLRNSCHR